MATGTIQFKEGATILGTATLSGGWASISPSTLPVGMHSITAVYSGDSNYLTSTSAVLMETVVKGPTSVTLTSSPNPSPAQQAFALTANVSPSMATGTVQFKEGGTVLGTATLSGGWASMSLSTLPVGTHSITAVYSGDSNYVNGTSAVLMESIVKASTSATLTSSPNPSIGSQVVILVANIAPSMATGSVQFFDGSSSLGTATLSGGRASRSVSTLVVGTHSIHAVYGGDANYLTSTSAIVTQTVSAPPPSAATNLTAAAASSSQINLNWKASPTSGVTYDIYSAATSGFVPSAFNRIAAGIAATNYSNSGLPPSTTRYYLVTAHNSGGESAPSNQATATTRK